MTKSITELRHTTPTAVLSGAEDVSDDAAKLREAQEQITAAYRSLLAPGVSLTPSEVFSELCRDGYDDSGRSRTVVVYSDNKEGRRMAMAGIVRVVMGTNSEVASCPAIDAMRFVIPCMEWPHRTMGLGDTHICELGRFVIPEPFRTAAMRRAGIPSAVTRSLVDKCMEIGRARGAILMYAIMPLYAARLVRGAGVELHEIPARLRINDEHASRVFDRFSTYWLRSTPRLYRFTAM